MTFNDYTKATGERFYAADSAPKLPAEIAGKISGVLGLSSYSHFRPMLRKRPSGGTGPGNAFSAADPRPIYSIPAQPFAPKTQVLGIFEQGGFFQSDIATYLAKMKLAGPGPGAVCQRRR